LPVSEALILFEALQYHGVPSELLVFPDENHWILKPRNIIVWYRAVLEFHRPAPQRSSSFAAGPARSYARHGSRGRVAAGAELERRERRARA